MLYVCLRSQRRAFRILHPSSLGHRSSDRHGFMNDLGQKARSFDDQVSHLSNLLSLFHSFFHLLSYLWSEGPKLQSCMRQR